MSPVEWCSGQLPSDSPIINNVPDDVSRAVKVRIPCRDAKGISVLTPHGQSQPFSQWGLGKVYGAG